MQLDTSTCGSGALAIENNLHWVLDMAFDQDSNRTRKGHSTANLAVISHIVLNLIKKEKNLNYRRKNKTVKSQLG